MKEQVVFFGLILIAQVSAAGQSFHELLRPQLRSAKLTGPRHFQDYVHDGKLQLGLHDAILLALENNSAIQVQETQVDSAKFSLLRAYQPFDPTLQSTLVANRYSYPGSSQIQGPGTFNELSHEGQFTYSQTFTTGTNIQVQLAANRYSTNSGFYFVNPSWNSGFNLQFTQPLLKNRWRFENRAPLIVAQKNLQASRATFESQVNDALLRVVRQYWDVVRARGNLDVYQRSLEAAQASYQRDQRALALGALPPLDIYRSQAEVASRRVQVLQAEYALKQAEDALRFTIGANQDSYIAAVDLDLTEKPEPVGDLKVIDIGTALQEAMEKRPELEAAREALQGDDVSIRLAQNHLQPDLSVSGFYKSSGVGGNQYSPVNPGQLISTGGLASSLNQVFGFTYPGYGASLTLNLPIRNRAAQADLGSALALRHRDLYSEQQVREQITLDVNTAVHQLEEAKLTLEAGQIALDLAEKTLSADQRKYELGSETVFFLLDAQTRLATARASLLQAQIDYQNAVAAVGYATGILLQSYQVHIADLMKE
ncbi:MAG TPA: TolC family protein [Terriglobales bacterium]|nr:TolC family protein [Terriglobales bacterium]